MSRASAQASVEEVGGFDTIIDARSPAEYAEDHLPGSVSLPVLSDEERARIGTLYKQVSAFEAKKLGAALVARNIARHIEDHLLDKPRDWRPLVYCWRGGQRSGAFSLILREIGWDARRLEGGYKAWRRHVIAQLVQLPARLQFHVISGATGSAKSRVLEALRARGAQTLHLEELAAHKGSVLGSLPERPQPGQKAFESQLYAALSRFSHEQPVFVEAESRKIGRLHLPEALIEAIRAAPGSRIDASRDARIDFLVGDYDYAVADAAWLLPRLEHLKGLQSTETVNRWQELVRRGEHRTLVGELLDAHYDPLYQRSQAANYPSYSARPGLATDDLSPAGIDQLAAAILATSGGTGGRSCG